MLIQLCILLVFSLGLCYGDTFTSIREMENLYDLEQNLVKALDQYLRHADFEVGVMELHYKELSKIESEIQDIDKYAENPVNAYSVVRRMHYDWPSTFKLMSTSPFFYEEPNFPDGSAITEAIAHLVEWQTEKKIATKLLARGLYEGIMPHANLTASDCFEIAKYCYNKDKNLAIEWLQEAFIKVEENIGGSAKLLAQILEYTFLAKCITGDKEGAYYAFQSLATDGAFWYSPSVKLSSDYKLDQVKKCKAAAKKSLKSKEKMYPSLFQHYDWSTELCHSIRRSTQAEAGYCYVYISWQYIQFIKYEDLEEEGITIIHNFLPDELLLEIKEAAMEKFKRLSIKGLNGPVPLVNKELVSTLNKRINSKLRLPLDILGEDQQIFAYGPGGKLESLETFNKQITGNRFGALYIFLSDVARGGHIVFPDNKVSIEPTKGTLVYWTNNEDSHNVEVKECPVEVGSKWCKLEKYL